MQDDYQDLIGQSIGIIDDSGHVKKKVTIAKVKQIGDDYAFLGDDGEIYSCEQLDFVYQITPQKLLFDALCQHEVLCEGDWNPAVFTAVFNDFMTEMEHQGYIQEQSNNKQ